MEPMEVRTSEFYDGECAGQALGKNALSMASSGEVEGQIFIDGSVLVFCAV
jgi:hypothetical protein